MEKWILEAWPDALSAEWHPETKWKKGHWKIVLPREGGGTKTIGASAPTKKQNNVNLAECSRLGYDMMTSEGYSDNPATGAHYSSHDSGDV